MKELKRYATTLLVMIICVLAGLFPVVNNFFKENAVFVIMFFVAFATADIKGTLKGE